MQTKRVNFLFIFFIAVIIYLINPFKLSSTLTDKVEDLFLNEGYIRYNKTQNPNQGSLVEEDDFSNLISSNITGESYDFNVLYYPYYSILNNNERMLYKQIYANAASLNKTFKVSETVSIDEVDKTIDAVFYDHPELFWLGNEYTYKYTKDNIVVEISLTFNTTIVDIEVAQRKFDKEINQILKDAYNLTTNYEKEKYIHDLLLKQITYDETAPNNQSAYSAIVNKRTVCAGYAKAFQLLLTKLNIPCYYVVGYANEAHAWNIVKLDGYYNVDLTWDDSKNKYKYFNKTDEEFNKTHTRTGISLNLPACNYTNYQNIEEEIEKNNNTVTNYFYNYIYKYSRS